MRKLLGIIFMFCMLVGCDKSGEIVCFPDDSYKDEDLPVRLVRTFEYDGDRINTYTHTVMYYFDENSTNIYMSIYSRDEYVDVLKHYQEDQKEECEKLEGCEATIEYPQTGEFVIIMETTIDLETIDLRGYLDVLAYFEDDKYLDKGNQEDGFKLSTYIKNLESGGYTCN
ncbi:hypothetical protein [Breznakia pachnodae]|uniref:Lipoprotein n=1 Tax=Breznakia pachnodae TaxID=265178 RepID=A0ABU0E5J1_9FIRM|nr:hypothetical protein [Breznakia pachnodae]MDQ0361775.1 hypothetical protein [Breznakia pachnodae]